ncbi:MAG: hypothetical protein WBK51_02120 [Polaromonas sp.]
MVHCFITGVQFELDEGFVLNRREARDLLDALKGRAASLMRIIEQLSPLDEPDNNSIAALQNIYRPPKKKHRLVCKAIADTLVPNFNEIRLFVSWPEYLAMSHQRRAALAAHTYVPTATDAVPDHEKKQQT